MTYNYDAWKNYKEVPRFIKEYARYKINKMIDNEYLSEDYVDECVKRIFMSIKYVEYGYMDIDECIRNIENA